MNSSLPATRWLYTGFLIVMCCGYTAALINLYLTFYNVDGNPLMTPNDIITHFHGNKNFTKLTQMINGPMRQYLANDEQKERLEQWVADGSTRAGYEQVQDIFHNQCIRCHDAFGEAEFAPLTSFDEVVLKTQPFQGLSWARIARLSHQHLLGIGFILFLTGMILFRTQYLVRIKIFLVLLGYSSLIADIAGWSLTKLASPFAYLVILGGALSGVSFGSMVLVSLYELWIKKD